MDRSSPVLAMVDKLGYFLVMVRINIHEAKTHLSRWLKRVEAGETLILCRHNVPVAEIRPLPVQGRKLRPIGLAKGQFTIQGSFFDPLPDDLLDAFEGREP